MHLAEAAKQKRCRFLLGFFQIMLSPFFFKNTPIINKHPAGLSVGYAGVNQQHQVRLRGVQKAHFQIHWSILNEAERQVSLRVEAAERLI